MTSLEKWCSAMRRSIRGLIVLSNFLCDIHNGRIDANVAIHFLQEVARRWSSYASRYSAVKMLNKVADSMPDMFCRGCVIPAVGIRLSRVMAFKDLVERNLDLAPTGYRIRAHYHVSQIRDLERRGLRGVAIDEMRTRRPFAWVTKRQALDEQRGDPTITDASEKIRNALGLVNLERDDQLVEIRYPDSFSNTIPIVAPTFIDGSDSPVYRSCAAADGWGRAVDLDTLGEGLPEALHRAAAFTGEFALVYLGELSSDHGDIDLSALLRMFPDQWGTGSFAELEKTWLRKTKT